ncbi:glutamine amidotransferase class-I [Syntrophobotulus glycolicus DSM 8271]|uniref:Glutamine amidotransferase class-I n=1 Tax=Syntrophobotulus glycolicus (strain DSM 8271 / FlGlyR) TaxID=645991 RepID=F0SZ80_SYNGF|nr:glutamine amidotransferase [Syntrophobotulus glycolicus]ADY57198.1 glutamine amidotransferase class-I [Syntrophobotulus glycolicus DSM 8271]
MKKLLLIKTGTTPEAIKERFGDAEEVFLRQMDVSEDTVIWPVYQEKQPPSLDDVSGMIITGANASVGSRAAWILFLEDWLRANAPRRIPTLGICFGHQLLADAFGGRVDFHPRGRETGTVDIHLTAGGRKDPLLGILPPNFTAHVLHAQTAERLPPGAVVLASSEHEQHHAFVYNDNIWGVQFHPEFTADLISAYIEEQNDYLLRKGYDVNKIRQSVRENHYGEALLKQFLNLLDHE